MDTLLLVCALAFAADEGNPKTTPTEATQQENKPETDFTEVTKEQREAVTTWLNDNMDGVKPARWFPTIRASTYWDRRIRVVKESRQKAIDHALSDRSIGPKGRQNTANARRGEYDKKIADLKKEKAKYKDTILVGVNLANGSRVVLMLTDDGKVTQAPNLATEWYGKQFPKSGGLSSIPQHLRRQAPDE